MCMGRMPDRRVESFGHKEMYELSLTIRRGDVNGFERIMAR